MRWLLLLISHGAILAIGFALGVYFLPILTAPEGPDRAMLEQSAKDAQFTATFSRDLKGSDFLHWGEGKISVGPKKIVHDGKLAPGPDYKLYLTKGLVEDEAAFERAKGDAIRLGDIKTFNGFVLEVPPNVDVSAYDSVLVWCESFGEFITAAKYR